MLLLFFFTVVCACFSKLNHNLSLSCMNMVLDNILNMEFLSCVYTCLWTYTTLVTSCRLQNVQLVERSIGVHPDCRHIPMYFYCVF